jgi:hypothetical protein
MPRSGSSQIVESTTGARAGTTGQGVRYVLLFGTLGVFPLFAGGLFVLLRLIGTDKGGCIHGAAFERAAGRPGR